MAAVLSAASLGVYDMRFVGELGRFAPDVHNEPASLGSSASLDRLERLIAGRSSPRIAFMGGSHRGMCIVQY